MSQQTPTPTQELVAKDIHGYEWRFKHIFRGKRLEKFSESDPLQSYFLLSPAFSVILGIFLSFSLCRCGYTF